MKHFRRRMISASAASGLIVVALLASGLEAAMATDVQNLPPGSTGDPHKPQPTGQGGGGDTPSGGDNRGGSYNTGNIAEIQCYINGQRIPVKSTMECQFGPGQVINGQSFFGGRSFWPRHHVASAMTYAYGASGTLYYGSYAAVMQAVHRDQGIAPGFGDPAQMPPAYGYAGGGD